MSPPSDETDVGKGIAHADRAVPHNASSHAQSGLRQPPAVVLDEAHARKAAAPSGRTAANTNSMRSQGAATEKRRANPPLEDRFNVIKRGWIERDYQFRDQIGKVAFTDRLLSIHSSNDSPAAIKAMVDRAAERGWATVRLNGSPEFVRQAWITANAHGLRAIGHAPTPGDKDAVNQERVRLEGGRSAESPNALAPAGTRNHQTQDEQATDVAGAMAVSRARQLAVTIERALTAGKVSPAIREQVRDMLAAEGARRLARGERFKAPLYDTQAARIRAKTNHSGPQPAGDRERSR